MCAEQVRILLQGMHEGVQAFDAIIVNTPEAIQQGVRVEEAKTGQGVTDGDVARSQAALGGHSLALCICIAIVIAPKHINTFPASSIEHLCTIILSMLPNIQKLPSERLSYTSQQQLYNQACSRRRGGKNGHTPLDTPAVTGFRRGKSAPCRLPRLSRGTHSGDQSAGGRGCP
eukprot:scaffold16723_cov143-Isochrysis_galbana.AAC.5